MKSAVVVVALLLSSFAFAQDITLTPLVTNLDKPVAIAHANDTRLFIGTQRGEILVHDGALLAEPFLDIRAQTQCCGEKGLLGIAFHPHYQQNGLFFVTHVDRDGATVLARYHVSANRNVADATSRTVLLTIPHPADAVHFAGHLAFGPDGYLYMSTGDGGDVDYVNASQLDSLLGKILRIDVDEESYGVPSTNPFAGTPGARPEIWAYGFRNPWCFSFDRATGDLWIGDVGQDLREEVDLQLASSEGGENYGWYGMEGSFCHEDSGVCESGEITAPPVIEYSHDDGGCAVTGGFRYRGTNAPELDGTYFYADFCTGQVFGATQTANGAWSTKQVYEGPHMICSFGEGTDGEIYAVDYRGTIYRLETVSEAEMRFHIERRKRVVR